MVLVEVMMSYKKDKAALYEAIRQEMAPAMEKWAERFGPGEDFSTFIGVIARTKDADVRQAGIEPPRSICVVGQYADRLDLVPVLLQNENEGPHEPTDVVLGRGASPFLSDTRLVVSLHFSASVEVLMRCHALARIAFPTRFQYATLIPSERLRAEHEAWLRWVGLAGDTA